MTRARDTLAPVMPRHWDRLAPSAEVHSQDEQRERRRNRLSVHYGARFDLATEVAEIVAPLAREASRLPRPEVLRREVDRVADGVGEVVHVAAGLVAESRAADGRTRRLAADLAVRPRQPVIADESLVSGSWSALLVDYAAQLADDLAALLGRALPPESEGLRGSPSASDRLVDALRILDREARELGRAIPRAAARQSLPSIETFNEQLRAEVDAERASAALSRLGMGAV